MAWQVPPWGSWHEDPRETEQTERAYGRDHPSWCEQCERVRTETCVACGDEDGLHAA